MSRGKESEVNIAISYCIYILKDAGIEEGLKQKARQNVVVLDWGSRLNAALGNLGVNV